jgi:Tol biopolymer transport system component
MADLEERFRSLSRTQAPDLWPEIDRREPSLEPGVGGPRRLAAALAAAIIAIAGFAVAVVAFRGDGGSVSDPGPADGVAEVTFIRNGELWAVPADGSSETRIALDVDGAVNGVSWAPDGSRMAVSIEVDPGTEGGQFHLYVANADGSGARRLTDGVSDRFPTWSPDGFRIAFTRDLGDGDQEIFLVNADGSAEVQLTDTDGANLQPTWSPDGSRIAFTSTRDGGGNSEIYVMNADGSDPRRLTNVPGWDAAPDWSSTGRIAYTSDGPESGVYVVDPDSGPSQLLLADPDPFNLFVSWSPDGRTLALASRRDDDAPALFKLDVQTRELTRVTGGGLVWGPAWRFVPSAIEPEPSPDEAIRGEIATTFPVGEDVRSVVYGAGSVWVAVSNNDGTFGGRILRIDPTTNEIVAEIPVEAIPGWEVGGGAMVVTDDSVWVTGDVEAPGNFESPGGGSDAAVVRIDVATNEVVDVFTLGGTGGADLTFLDGVLWVLAFGDESVDSMEVIRVDPSTGSVLARIPLRTNWAHTIAATAGRLHVIEYANLSPEKPGGQMTSIDPATNVATSAEIRSSYSAIGPVVWRDQAWAWIEGGFARFDARTGEVIDRSPALDPRRLSLGRMSVEADDRGIWFLGYNGLEGGGPVRLALFDPATGAVSEVVTLGEGNPIAMAVAPDSVWILNNEGTLTRVDLIGA